MKRLLICTLIITNALFLCGCMHTVIGGNPVRSPDMQYKLGMEAHGASAQAYTATTKKRVYLWLGPNTTNNTARPIWKKYVFVAAGLDWKVEWHGSEEVAVQFFDYGDGIPSGWARETGTPSNHIASLQFRKTQTGEFIEVK
jgi:hypothetical protein